MMVDLSTFGGYSWRQDIVDLSSAFKMKCCFHGHINFKVSLERQRIQWRRFRRFLIYSSPPIFLEVFKMSNASALYMSIFWLNLRNVTYYDAFRWSFGIELTILCSICSLSLVIAINRIWTSTIFVSRVGGVSWGYCMSPERDSNLIFGIRSMGLDIMNMATPLFNGTSGMNCQTIDYYLQPTGVHRINTTIN